MSLDRKQFITTADGTSVRLFPENYGIIHRRFLGGPWEIGIDPAVPETLAVEIFRTLHTSHDLRWGGKEALLAALNNLLTQPLEDTPDPEYTTDWEPDEILGGYHFWVRHEKGVEIHQCTITGCPPQTQAGYCDKRALVKLKGIDYAGW